MWNSSPPISRTCSPGCGATSERRSRHPMVRKPNERTLSNRAFSQPSGCRLGILVRKTDELSFLSSRGTSGERTEERGKTQQKRLSSPRPSPPTGREEREKIDLLAGPRCLKPRFKRRCLVDISATEDSR